MPRHEFDALFEQYPDTIRLMKTKFDSHDFIIELARCNQRLYIEALTKYASKPAPFKRVHGILSRHLHALPELVRHTGTAHSNDIFTNENQCASRRKVISV